MYILLGVFFFSGEFIRAASFQGIGDLGGTFFSEAYGVSDDGSVVVGRSFNTSAQLEAVRWTSGGGIVGLGDLAGGSFISRAYGVSGDGLLAVGEGNSTASTPNTEAFRWTSGGGIVGLGDLAGGDFSSLALGASSDGSVVVGASSSAASAPFFQNEAFRWTSGGGMVGLGDLAGGDFNSSANAVSSDGSVIAGLAESASGFEAFRWTSGGGIVGLGDLAGGGFSSQAIGISNDGSVVVGQGESALGFEAFRWTSGGGMVGLGDLSGGNFGSTAFDVSSDGSIVVGSGQAASFNEEAFVWDATNGIRNLKTVLEGLGLDLTGWTLTKAQAVSADGTIIVGIGTSPNGTEGFIADISGSAPVPEPATLILLSSSLLAFFPRFHRK